MTSVLNVNEITKDFFQPVSYSELIKFKFKHIRPNRALDNVSFSLEKGKMLGILGPNGAGKTTLLKIIATLILPDKGDVVVNSYRPGIDDNKIKSFIGLVASQERSFYWQLTGRQNLEFFAAMYGLDEKYAQFRTKELFALFEINYQDKRFDSYSSGMKQRFALMRALLNEPQLLLLDEPTKSLDYKTALALREFIKNDLVEKKGKTVIFTTHNINEALDFCDLFLILNKGKVCGFGTLAQLQKKLNNPSATLGEVFLALT